MKTSEIQSVLSKNKYNYPMVIWSEIDSHSQIILATNPETFKVIFEFKDHSFKSFIKDLEDKLHLENILDKTILGDELVMPLDVFEFDENDLKWSELSEYILKNYHEYTADKALTKEINLELEKNHIADYSASILESVYSSILYFLLNKSTEIGVVEIMFLGNIVFDERLNSIIHRDLPETINISMANL